MVGRGTFFGNILFFVMVTQANAAGAGYGQCSLPDSFAGISEAARNYSVVEACGSWIDNGSQSSMVRQYYSEFKACFCGAGQGLKKSWEFVSHPMDSAASVYHGLTGGMQALIANPGETYAAIKTEVAKQLKEVFIYPEYLAQNEMKAINCEAITGFALNAYAAPKAAMMAVKNFKILKKSERLAMMLKNPRIAGMIERIQRLKSFTKEQIDDFLDRISQVPQGLSEAFSKRLAGYSDEKFKKTVFDVLKAERAACPA